MTQFKMIIEAGTLRGITNVLSCIVDECRINFEKNKIIIKTVDPAHVAMMDIEIKSKFLNMYKCTEPGELGIDLGTLRELLLHLDDKELVKISYDGDGKISLMNDIFWTTINPVDTNGMSKPKLPSLTLPAGFEIEYKKLKKVIRILASRMDIITISYTPDEGVSFYNVNDKEEITKAKFPKDLLPNMNWPETLEHYDCLSHYPQDYLLSFINSLEKITLGNKQLVETVKVQMGNDYPIHFVTKTKGLRILYVTAPRIMTE